MYELCLPPLATWYVPYKKVGHSAHHILLPNMYHDNRGRLSAHVPCQQR